MNSTSPTQTRYRSPRGLGYVGRIALLLMVVSLTASLAVAQDATVTYVEGFPELQRSGGQSLDLTFGDFVGVGDSVVTGPSDVVDLAAGDGAELSIAPNTVFEYNQRSTATGNEPVLTVALGAIAYRYNRVAGNEPRIGTNSVVAGVRGTELEVFAGSDGSSLFVVREGLVAVESAGEAVELAANQGVQVAPGEPPGEPFEARFGEIDFSTWNEGREVEIRENPVMALARVGRQLENFAEEIRFLGPENERLNSIIEDAREAIRNEEDEEAADELRAAYAEDIRPLETRQTQVYNNLRFYARSALSLRQYVMARMYVLVKTSEWDVLDGDVWRAYEALHQEILDEFDDVFTPWLTELDI